MFYRHLQDDDYQNGSVGTNGALAAKRSINAPKAFLNDLVDDVSISKSVVGQRSLMFVRFYQDHDPMAGNRVPRVADRQDEYRARARNRKLSPERIDPYADGTVYSDCSKCSFDRSIRYYAPPFLFHQHNLLSVNCKSEREVQNLE